MHICNLFTKKVLIFRLILVFLGSSVVFNATALAQSTVAPNEQDSLQNDGNDYSGLVSGVYYGQGTLYNNSRREILAESDNICIKTVNGPPSPYRGEEQIVISTISMREGKLYIDATDQEISVYVGQEIKERFSYIRTNPEVVFSDGIRVAWALNSQVTSDPRTTEEQDAQMQACINSPDEYIHRMQGVSISGIDF